MKQRLRSLDSLGVVKYFSQRHCCAGPLPQSWLTWVRSSEEDLVDLMGSTNLGGEPEPEPEPVPAPVPAPSLCLLIDRQIDR
eukprot:COSAG05_NODE_155_length_15704_cov_84.777315_7_plen_82_part_00